MLLSTLKTSIFPDHTTVPNAIIAFINSGSFFNTIKAIEYGKGELSTLVAVLRELDVLSAPRVKIDMR